MKFKQSGNFKNKLCDADMSFDDCELAILRHAVDETEKKQGMEKVNNEDVKKMLVIVEDFLRKKKLICYGGTAINNILPKYAQFYKRDIQIPDYDFFSPNPIDDAKELANIYYKNGYTDVEAKSGVHFGTFKVFVNYIPIADITFLHPKIYNSISRDVIKINGLRYAPPDFLRMSMYLELSRPDGDVSRWEKILKRLALLNKYHPLKTKNCDKVDFSKNGNSPTSKLNTNIRNNLIDQGVVFFGGYSTYLYSKHMNEKEKSHVNTIPDYDVLSEEPKKCADILIERLHDSGYKDTKIVVHEEIGEIIPLHYEVNVNNKSYVFIYEPIACHSYNKINIGDKEVNVATIETILSFYLAFIYANERHYNKDRLLCISKYLFDVIEENKLTDKGLLKRFTINCYGKQNTLEDIRSEKAMMFKKFADEDADRKSEDYQMWFLKYSPYKESTNEEQNSIVNSVLKTTKKKVKSKTRKLPSPVKNIKSKTLRKKLSELFM